MDIERPAPVKNRFALLVKLLAAILVGTAFGVVMRACDCMLPVSILATFNSQFKEFLNYCVPLLVLGYVTAGIAGLGRGAGKALGFTLLFALVMLTVAGFSSFFIARSALPYLLPTGGQLAAFEASGTVVQSLFDLAVPPFMDGMTATVTAFILGAGISTTGHSGLRSAAAGLEKIVDLLVRRVIVPLLPIHAFGIFASLAYSGAVFHVLSVFSGVIALIVVLQSVFLLIQYGAAGAATRKNPLRLMQHALPAYVGALGTQSSSAVIPVSEACAERNGVSREMSSFLCPLCASNYLPGSMISLTIGAMALLTLENGTMPTFAEFAPFILRLVLVIVAAPGVPGGAVTAGQALFTSQLGFDVGLHTLMTALNLSQDSFESACNASSDGAAAIFLEALLKRGKKQEDAA